MLSSNKILIFDEEGLLIGWVSEMNLKFSIDSCLVEASLKYNKTGSRPPHTVKDWYLKEIKHKDDITEFHLMSKK